MINNLTSAAIIVVLCSTPLLAQEPQAGSNLGSVQGGVFKTAHSIIEHKCNKCHSDKRIDAALSASKDMPKIQQEMEKKGARLSAKDQEMLGIYWKQQNPLKQ
jgi:uncharacterized membrane protein